MEKDAKSYESKMVEFYSNGEQPLVELQELLSSFEVKTGEITKSARDDLHFDPVSAGIAAYKILAVVTTLGSAAQIVDWIRRKLREMKDSDEKVIVKVGKSTIQLDSSQDPEVIVDALRTLLGAIHR